MTKQLDYPYLRAWCRMMGSAQYYTDMQIERAREDKAPQTAIYLDNDGVWKTFENIGREDTKERIRTMVEGVQVAPGLKVSEV